jgi:putative component of membrane protein insertase Oxa1/YidC/SpoIIIJ protein YidD
VPVTNTGDQLAPGRQSAAARLLMLAVKGYRLLISPLLPPSCRFYPSCSAYALEALQVHGALRGSWLAVRPPVPRRGPGSGAAAPTAGHGGNCRRGPEVF